MGSVNLADSFYCSISEGHHTPRRVHVSGAIDTATVGQLGAAMRDPRVWESLHVILDLRKVGFIDSRGVKALLELELSARNRGVLLEIVSSAVVDRALALTNTRRRLRVSPIVDPQIGDAVCTVCMSPSYLG